MKRSLGIVFVLTLMVCMPRAHPPRGRRQRPPRLARLRVGVAAADLLFPLEL
jgi:hypothetical protein